MITFSRIVVFVLFVIVAFVALGLAAFLLWLAVYAVGWALFGRRDRGRHRGRRRWRTARVDPHPDVPLSGLTPLPPRPSGPPPGHVWITAAGPDDTATRELPKIQETAA